MQVKPVSSPSPHGRVGTISDATAQLIVQVTRRPLMVGSEQEAVVRAVRYVLRSPSPHGRVGTLVFRVIVAVSTHRRRPLMVGSEPRQILGF